MLISLLLLLSLLILKHLSYLMILNNHPNKISSSRTIHIQTSRIHSRTKYLARITKCINFLRMQHRNKVCKESAHHSKNRRLFLMTITISFSNNSSSNNTCKRKEFHIKVVRSKHSTETIRRCLSHLLSRCSSFDEHFIIIIICIKKSTVCFVSLAYLF